MFRVVALLLLAVPVLACNGNDPAGPKSDGGPEGVAETFCANSIDDDADGTTDCDDPDCSVDNSCRPTPPKPCSTQKDCGGIDMDVRKCCLHKAPTSDEEPGDLRCFAPGASNAKGDSRVSEIAFTLEFDNSFMTSQNKPKTTVLRFIYPETIDGASLTCTQVRTLNGATEATRSALDDNPQINQVFRDIYRLEWNGSTFSFPASVPWGERFILYGEVWYGAQDQSNPSGNRAATSCQEGFTIDENAAARHYELTFRPGT